MNAKRVNTVADAIQRSMDNGRKTPAAWAMALESAQLLQSPETAAELERLRARVAELEAERHVTNEALDDAVQELGRRKDAESPLTVFRASHDSIVMGRYTTRAEARKHCETVLRRDLGDDVWIGWVPDHGGDDAPEELCFGEDVECSGYYVTPLEIASEYDEEADE